MQQLQQLFGTHSFWAQGRSLAGLHRMLQGSEVVVTAWRDGRLVGFGRCTSDGAYRAVLWDVVVARSQEGQGLGRRLVATLLAAPPVAAAERVYLMTTNSHGFYERLGFHEATSQRLMRLG
jgi:N-acetylglutamate synthase-like GNAT family acetyltransferase